MSYYSRKNGILFIHIAKNAGRAISKSLKIINNGNYPGVFDGSGHSTLFEFNEIKYKVDEVKFTFAVLRDPLERFRSAYTSCFDDDEYSSVDECISMLETWEKKDSWSRGTWNFSKMANKDRPPNGFYFPIVPRAQFVPQVFYFSDHDPIRLYDIKDLNKLKKDLLEELSIRINILHYREPYTRSKPILSDIQKERLKRIYKEDFKIYEKISML